MKVFVNGVQRSTINGDGLCKALLGVYLDKDAVSPSLKKSVAETVSKWL